MLREDIQDFLQTIPKHICVVAATKYVDSNQMIELLEKGIYNFGENRVEVFLKKEEELKEYPIVWHFIGHLQRNKAKQVLNKIEYLHSLDSLELVKIIEKERKEPLKCFIEVSINKEETKNGVYPEELEEFIKKVLMFSKVKLVGFMMMAKKDSKPDELLHQFKSLVDLRNEIERNLSISLPYLSMGMSDDYLEAIQAGATHIRLGRILWKN